MGAKRKIKQNEEISVAFDFATKRAKVSTDRSCSDTDEGDENVISSSGDVTPAKKSSNKGRKRKQTACTESADDAVSVSPDSTTKVYGNINWSLSKTKPTLKTESGDSGTEVSPKPKKQKTSRLAKARAASK